MSVSTYTAPQPRTYSDSQPRILFVTEAHFAYCNGQWCAPDGVNGDTQWGRYHLPESTNVVLARTKDEITTGDPITAMEVAPIPDYRGLKSAIMTLPKVAFRIFREVSKSDLVVARVPGPLSILAASYAKALRKPYAIEIVGDIYDVLSQGAVPGAQRLAAVGRWITKRVCVSAAAGRYVTQQTLQKTYPTRNSPRIAISNVQINDALRRETPLKLDSTSKRLKIIAVGSQEVNYKGHDVAIEAIGLAKKDYQNGILSSRWLAEEGYMSSSGQSPNR